MLRRTLAFIAFVALVAAVSTLVYLNPEETAFRYPPAEEVALPLGVLMLASAVAGMVVMFVLMLLREGRTAVREWRVQRGIRSAERTATLRAEARSLALAGDYARARSLFSKAMKTREPDLADLLDYADTYIQEGDAREAKRIIENAQKDFGNAPLLLSALARAARLAGDHAGAASALERALAVYPRSLRLLVPLRDVLVDMGEWGRAAEIQERTVALASGDTVERNRLLGIRYEAAQRTPPVQRIATLKSISSTEPDFVPAVVERARAIAADGDARRAIRILEKAIRQRPRGVVFDELENLIGEEDPARLSKAYLRAIEAFPHLDGLRARAARQLARNGRHDEAASILKDAASTDTRSSLTAARAFLEQARGRLTGPGEGSRTQIPTQFPTPSGRCDACKSLSDRWTARCIHCGAWGFIDDL